MRPGGGVQKQGTDIEDATSHQKKVTWPIFCDSEQAKVETPFLARYSPVVWLILGGGTRYSLGSFSSPSYCIIPANLICSAGKRRLEIRLPVSNIEKVKAYGHAHWFVHGPVSSSMRILVPPWKPPVHALLQAQACLVAGKWTAAYEGASFQVVRGSRFAQDAHIRPSFPVELVEVLVFQGF